jgi:ankyrin repeat protein
MLKQLIEAGDVDAIDTLLAAQPALANEPIHWHLNQDNRSDPLHYIADCVSNGWLSNGREGELTASLLAHGAAIDGNDGRESPLIAAASLGSEKMARVLIEAGADLELTSIFDANALHWAAWMGLAETVQLLIDHGAALETKCTEFGATPLFWAVHGFGPNGPKEKRNQVGAAKALFQAGATVQTMNKEGTTALEMAKRATSPSMTQLLRACLD